MTVKRSSGKGVAETKKVKEALKKADEKLHFLFMNIPDIVMIASRDGTILDINHTVKGLSVKKVIGMNLSDYEAQNFICIRKEVMEKVFKTGKPSNYEILGTGPKGPGTAWYETWVAPIKHGKKVIAMILITRDISERKKSEEALRDSEEKYRKQFDEALDAIFIADAKTGIILDCNRAACELIGRKKSELVGKHQSILHPPVDIKEKFSRTFKQHLKEKEGQILEAGVITKKGEIKYVAIKANIFKLKGKKFIQGIFRDITKQKKTEEDLKESEEKFRTIFEGAGDGILAADANTKRFVFANPRMCGMVGFSLKELLKLNVDKIHPKKDLPYVMDQFTKQLQGKIILAKDIPVLRKDGKVIYCDVSSEPVKMGKNELLLGFFRDITEQKKTEEKIKESEKKYKTLYESSRDAIMTLAPPTWVFTSGNPATVKMFRVKDEKEFTSKELGDFSPKFQPDGQLSSVKAKNMIMKAMKEGSNFFEWTHKHITGEDFPATVLLTRIELEGKQLLQATVRDITEQKKAHEELLKAYQSRSDLIENAPFGVITINTQGIVEYINPAMLMISGSDEKKFIGLNLLALSTYVKTGLAERIKACLKGKSFFVENVEYISHFGKKRSVRNFTGLPIRDKTGKIEEVTLFVEDITREKEAEERIWRRTNELEKFNKVAIGRELKMVELKKRIIELEAKLKKKNNKIL